MTIWSWVSGHWMMSLGILTQSLSFLTVGTPISSKVLGPFPGRPWELGFAGWPPGFWPAELGGADGLGVDDGESLDSTRGGNDGEAGGLGELEFIRPAGGRGETGVLTGLRSGGALRLRWSSSGAE